MIMPLKFEKFNFRALEMADHDDNIRVKADEKSIYQQEFDKNISILKQQEYQPRRKREKIFTYKITIMFNFIN
jgi:hypothetical protein